MKEIERLKRRGLQIGIGLFFCLAFANFPVLAGNYPQLAHSGPSFSCSEVISETEVAICTSAELAAYDRAIAWAYSNGWTPDQWTTATQRSWLRGRDSCGGKVACILSAYRLWIGEIDSVGMTGRTFERGVSVRDKSRDLKSGKEGTPYEAKMPTRDDGSLSIQAIGAEWYIFRVHATHWYDPDDGRGLDFSTSEAIGVVHLPSGAGIWIEEPEYPDSCSVKFVRFSSTTWQLEETNGGCSGMGSTLSGYYQRK